MVKTPVETPVLLFKTLEPDQSPEAVQLVALAEVQVKLDEPPLAILTGPLELSALISAVGYL